MEPSDGRLSLRILAASLLREQRAATGCWKREVEVLLRASA